MSVGSNDQCGGSSTLIDIDDHVQPSSTNGYNRSSSLALIRKPYPDREAEPASFSTSIFNNSEPMPSRSQTQLRHPRVDSISNSHHGSQTSLASTQSDRPEAEYGLTTDEFVQHAVRFDKHGFTLPRGTTMTELSEKQLKEIGRLDRKREMKWIKMLADWPNYMNKHFVKVKQRCRKGIPHSMRYKAWTYLCGAHFEKEIRQVMKSDHNSFQILDKKPGNPHDVNDIEKDLHRQFPDHEMFVSGEDSGKLGQEDLFRLLKAYTVKRPEEGYCQGQAPIAATLLTRMPLEDAFYCFDIICDDYLSGYFNPNMEMIRFDGLILQKLLRQVCRPVYRHLKIQEIDPYMYMLEWFMAIYTRTLPWDTVLRVWDMFLCEGVKVLFKVGLVLLKYGLGNPQVRKECPFMFDTLDHLKHLPDEIKEVEFMMRKILELDLVEEDFERAHLAVLKDIEKDKRRKAKPLKEKRSFPSLVRRKTQLK